MTTLFSRLACGLRFGLPVMAALLAGPIVATVFAAPAEARERPEGDWHRYCRDASVRGDWLEADCRRQNGGWRRNTRINFDACPGNEVTVRDGYLICERRYGGGWNGHNGGGYGWNDRDRWDHDRWDRDRWDHDRWGNNGGWDRNRYAGSNRFDRDGHTYIWNGRQYVVANSRGDWDRRDNDRHDGDRRDNDRHDWDRKQGNDRPNGGWNGQNNGRNDNPRADNGRNDNRGGYNTGRNDNGRNDNGRNDSPKGNVVRRDDNRAPDTRPAGTVKPEPTRRDADRRDDNRKRNTEREDWWKQGSG